MIYKKEYPRMTYDMTSICLPYNYIFHLNTYISTKNLT